MFLPMYARKLAAEKERRAIARSADDTAEISCPLRPPGSTGHARELTSEAKQRAKSPSISGGSRAGGQAAGRGMGPFFAPGKVLSVIVAAHLENEARARSCDRDSGIIPRTLDPRAATSAPGYLQHCSTSPVQSLRIRRIRQHQITSSSAIYEPLSSSRLLPSRDDTVSVGVFCRVNRAVHGLGLDRRPSRQTETVARVHADSLGLSLSLVLGLLGRLRKHDKARSAIMTRTMWSIA